MTLTTRQLLIAARGVFQRHRTTGVYAASASNLQVAPDDPAAACFCAYGALMRVARGCGPMAPDKRLHYLRDRELEDSASSLLFIACLNLADLGPIDINDDRNDPDLILRAYDLAIERA